MVSKQAHISIYEHESIYTHKGKQRLTNEQLKALQSFYGTKGLPYYTLLHKGVRFCSYVGVLRVGNTTIEILPKSDKNQSKSIDWRSMLIGMLRAAAMFDVEAPSRAYLKVKSNAVLTLYFDLLIKELNYLLRRGLVKQYRKTKGHLPRWKGKLNLEGHLKYNVGHPERFYMEYTTYDEQHVLHQILYKALLMMQQLHISADLRSRIGKLLLDFPKQEHIRVNERLFAGIRWNRQTKVYQNAIHIARLLLLNYHPDLSRGQNHVLALLFDMNLLWEQFVYHSLKKHLGDFCLVHSISTQNHRRFWKPEQGQVSTMRPDILINYGRADCLVIDTKWKALDGGNPSVVDLRQLYVYHGFYQAKKVALVYPGSFQSSQRGFFYLEDDGGSLGDKECQVICIPAISPIKEWGRMIAQEISRLFS